MRRLHEQVSVQVNNEERIREVAIKWEKYMLQ